MYKKTTNTIMKKLILTGLVIVLTLAAFSQENYNVNMEIKTESARYPSGDLELHKYLFQNIKYTHEAIEAKVKGQLMISVDVEPDSTVSNITFFNSIGYGIDEQVKALIMPLKFAPKIMNGRVFKGDVMYNIVIQAH